MRRFLLIPPQAEGSLRSLVEDAEQAGDPIGIALPWTGERPNTGFYAEWNGVIAHVPMRQAAKELVGAAIATYRADELEPRHDRDDGWTRRFEILLPARSEKKWERVTRTLADALLLLSGDQVTIRTLPYAYDYAPFSGKQHQTVAQGVFDTVTLFSGGLDSLVETVRLLEDNRRVLLVSHCADTPTAGAQNRILEKLRQHYGPGAFDHLRFNIRSKTKLAQTPRFPLPPLSERSHRTRSFLFLALAAAAAEGFGVKQVTMPENGFIALNLPLDPSRTGTLSTRTAHPQFLARVEDILKRLGIDVALWNPFALTNKIDLCAEAPDFAKALFLDTLSCSKPGRSGQYDHCGYCVPCIHRRAAFWNIGILEECAQNPVSDLGRVSVAARRDLVALVRFARYLENATRLRISMLLQSHGILPPLSSKDHEKMADMVVRWAKTFLEFIDDQASKETKRLLGLGSRPS